MDVHSFSKRTSRLVRALFALAVLGCALLASPASAATYPAGFTERTLASGLTVPTAVAWAPDGRMFIAEKAGKLKVVSAAGVLRSTPVIDVSARTSNYGDRGLLGIAVDSNYASNHYVYLLYTYDVTPMTPDSSNPTVSRLSRIVVNDDNTLGNGGAETVILGSYSSGPCPTPSNTVDCIPSDDSSHSIGTVRSAPDGTLWLGSGDASGFGGVDARAFGTYNEQSFRGKIMHVDRNGRGLAGHPFCPTNTDTTQVCTKIYAKGFRNPFRFHLRPSGGVAVGDVGWSTREEVDFIAGGKSYGWPCYEGSIHTPSYQDRAECQPEYAKEGTANAHVGPNYEYQHGLSQSIILGPTYQGTSYPAQWRGDMFYGDYVTGELKGINLDANGNVSGSPTQLASDWTGTDIEAAPNGNLTYVDFGTGAAGSGTVKQITFASGNRPPVAAAAADPEFGTAPLTVDFSSAGTSDPDGAAGLTYDWNFGDGTAHSTAPNPTHTYSSGAQNYTATLTVTDPSGASDTDTVTISPGNTPPNASITAPASYRDGATINISGSATDPQQGTLPASAYDWDVQHIHGSHVHLVTSPDDVTSFNFPAATDHDADSHYVVRLTVTDSRGLTDTTSSTINPETRQFTLASSPSGAPLTYAGTSQTAPFTKQSAIGFKTSIAAAQTFTSAGKSYEFVSWSDGGARLHDVTIPATDSSITATYREVTSTTPEDKALGRNATASSVKTGTGWGPELGVDGNASTRWSSAWGVNNQWWQVDLGSARQVDKVTVNWFTSYATRYLISTSTDGSSFTQAADVTNGAAGNKTTTFAARSARYVRITGLTRAVPEYGISFWTASVFGPSDSGPPPPPPPPDPKALLVVKDAAAMNGGDTALRNRLTSLGYTVTTRSETATAADASGMDVVLISATVTSGNVNSKFRTVAVPVLVMESLIFDDMGMTAANAANFGSGQTAVQITNTTHPLAAGLTGTPAVTTTSNTFAWGTPTASAAKVATFVGDASKSAIFGYTSGAAMSGLNAPARRVGFFFSNDTPAIATANGWKLFDAAVGWARTGS